MTRTSQRTLPKLKEQRRELLRRDEELRVRIAELERQVKEAPMRLTEEIEEKVGAIQAQAAAERSLIDTRASLSDKRYVDAGEDERPMRRMRMHINAERRAFVWRCVMLLAVLAGLLAWLRAVVG